MLSGRAGDIVIEVEEDVGWADVLNACDLRNVEPHCRGRGRGGDQSAGGEPRENSRRLGLAVPEYCLVAMGFCGKKRVAVSE